jgi:hypothetical protein
MTESKIPISTCRRKGDNDQGSLAVEISKSKICDFVAQVRQQFVFKLGELVFETYGNINARTIFPTL